MSKSTIDSVSSVALGDSCRVVWTPKSTSYSYRLTFTLGSWSHKVGPIIPNRTTAYAYTGYKIPIVVAQQIPTSPSASMKVVLETFSDKNATKSLGTDDATFSVKVPATAETIPSIEDATCSIAGANTSLEAFADMYLQNVSSVLASFTAQGKLGASIAKQYVTIEGKQYPGSSIQSNVLNGYGPVSVEFTAVDTRNISYTKAVLIDVTSYDTPKIKPSSGNKSVICKRCDSAGNYAPFGQYLKIIAKREYSKCGEQDGKPRNKCIIRWRYKRTDVSNAEYTKWETLLSKDAVTDSVNVVVGPVEPTHTYRVNVGVKDDIGNYNTESFVISGTAYMHRVPGGKGMGLGKYCEFDGLDIGWKTIFRNPESNVDLLTAGKRIDATAESREDLDDYKTPGNYAVHSAIYAQYIDHGPRTNGGYRLEVRELQNESYIRQTAEYATTTAWRYWNGEGWSPWYKVVTELLQPE